MEDIVRDIFKMIGWVITGTFLICTIAMLILAYKDIDNTFFMKFAGFYFVLGFLAAIYLIIEFFINIKRLKWKKIRKLLFSWFIWSIVFWISIVIITYLIKGELRLTEKIVNSIVGAFGMVFGRAIYGFSNDD